MKVDLKDIGKSNKEITVELSELDFGKYLGTAAAHLSEKHAIKGFRPGKAPLSIVEEIAGSEELYKEAAIVAINSTYPRVAEEHELEIIGEPKFDILKIAKGNPFIYKVTVALMPEVELPDYKTIVAEANKKKEKIEVGENEVEDALEWLRTSRVKNTETGEENKEEEKLPELNDEFAKTLGTFKNLEELKANIRVGLTQEKEMQAKEGMRTRAIQKVARESKFEIPRALLEHEMRTLRDDLDARLRGMNITYDDYLKSSKRTKEEAERELAELAKDRVTQGLVLRAIARSEHIEASEAEITEEANKFLAQFTSAKEAEKTIDPARLRAYTKGIIENQKVFELLEKL